MPGARLLKHAAGPSAQGAVEGRATGNLTLADVARMARVSPITVSRVLNHPHLVTVETRRHIQEVIERTGYTPNLLAGELFKSMAGIQMTHVPYKGSTPAQFGTFIESEMVKWGKVAKDAGVQPE